MTASISPQPAAKIAAVADPPAAGRARLKLRHFMVMISFILFVAAPVTGAAWYLYTQAADQYASKVGFTVRREEVGSAMEILGGLTSLSSASSSDIDILYEFIQSQELVRAIDAKMDLEKIYSKPERDKVYRLTPDASIEDKVDYWSKMVRLTYAAGTGLIEVEVRAFDPQDAHNIAQELFDQSSAMINELSSVARSDATGYARDELDQAVARLKKARQALTLFRNETQIVDPLADIAGRMGLLNSLQSQLAESLIDADLQEGANDPRLKQTRRRIEVIEQRIQSEREKLGVRTPSTNDSNTSSENEVYADLIGTFESLSVDLEFAEKAYLSSLSAYDAAVAEARRQSRYLAAYLRPTLSETPRYPDRILTLAVVSMLLFGIWMLIVLVAYSLKDRR